MMKREIHIRAWDGEQMYQWWHASDFGEYLFCARNDNYDIVRLLEWGDERLTKMFGTKIGDRIIYEGDVLSQRYSGDHVDTIEVVVLQPTGFYLMMKSAYLKPVKGYLGTPLHIKKKTKFLGNIYENPELLK